jgi:(p)ppGpp synthase/HD superfamily hydrolase
MNIVEKAKNLTKLLTPNRAAHAQRVAKQLINPSENELAAAYLHDILEDTHLKEDQLVEEVGVEVTEMVKKLTNPMSIYSSRIRDFSHLKDAIPEVKRIKLSDRIDNIKKRVYAANECNVWALRDYAKETAGLLEIIKDGDENLAQILSTLLSKLKKNCNKYA